MSLLAVAVAAVGITGCADDDRPPTWSYIHEAIIEPNCTQSACHSNISATAGVELWDRELGFTVLTGRPCQSTGSPAEADGNFVVPGDPASSRLVYMLRGIETRNMPPDIPLPDTDIRLIEDWILRGAPCD